jgi:hypothetical protein
MGQKKWPPWEAIRIGRRELRLLGVGAAPTFGRYLFASKQGASTSGVTGFTLEEGAVAAVLTGGELGELGFVNASGIGLVTQTCGGWVFFVRHREGCKSRSAQQSTGTETQLHCEFTTI